MVLQLVHGQRLRNMPAVFPIPDLKIGKIPFSGQEDAERPLQVFNLPIRHLLPLKSKLLQLGVIQGNTEQIIRAVPVILGARLHVYFLLIPIQTDHFPFSPRPAIIRQYQVADP